LNLPCGYSGTLTASKLPCFPVNSTSVSINSSPLTISLPLTSTNVTIFGSVVPASGSLTITGGGPYTYNSSTGEYSFIRPCGWTGNVTYNSTCFNPQTQIISNAVSNTQADFNLAPSVPVGLSVVAPAFDAQMTTCSTEIQWSDLAPAGDYEYEVLATNLAGSVTYLATTTNAPYALVPHGLSGTVVWKVRARIIGCPTWSAWVSSQFKSPYIVVTSPLSSSNWEKGSAQTIIWTSGGLGSASVRISLANTAGDSIYAITNSTPNDGSQNWVTTYAVPAGSYRIRIATNKPDAPCVIALSNIFTISDRNCNEFFINQPVPTTSEAYLATCYLIQKGIIIPQQDGNYNSVTKLKRYLAAKIFFIGNYGDSAALTPADDFLTPFPDLNPNLADNATIRSYRRWARVMTLLEYNDTRTAFDHDTFFSFRGEDNIEEIYYIKALLEAFNINVETYTIPAHFPGEIEADNPMFKWVQKAVDLGIITTSEEPTTTPITRERAFILLYRLLSNPSIMRATPADLHNQENFFIHTISNETNGHTGAGASEAGLNFSQVCLDNANRGFRAVFGFSYSSQSLEMGKELFPNEFLGRGYNFTGNSYMIDYDDLPAYSQFIPADNHLVFNIDGSLLYFKKVGTSYQIQNKGVYGLVVTKISATEYTLRTRDNTLYRFRQLGDNKQPFLLVSLEDRFGNGYTITYEDAVAPATLPYTGYLKKRPQSINFLSCSYRFTYVTDKNLIHKVTEFGSINRFVTFSYNANDNLATYKDVTDTNLYQFWYLTDTTASIKHKENLLWKVRLPKGNIMTNEYNRKKLTSQQVQGPSGTVSRTLYDAKPNENKTTITIDNPEDSTPATASGALGAQDRRYNVEYYPGPWRLQKKVTGPNTNVHYSYADAAHPTLPTKIIDWNITTEYQYNATGDVIQKKITGTDGSVRIQEWTYNSFGDVLTYKDPLGNVTQWQYNAAGALTAIIPPLGWTYRTTYSPNSWGGNDYIQDPYGNRVHFDYQALTGNVWRVRSPLDTVLNTFDAAHRLQITQIRNDGNTANAQAKAYQYDALNRPTRETVAASGMTTGIKLDILYDANGNVIKYINDSGQETTLGYDTHTDFLISESFGGATRTRSYYGDGRLKTITKADGTTLLFEYTNDGRIEKVKNQTTSEVLFTYYYGFGGNPNLVWYILDKFNNKVRYTYDDLNQVIKLDYEYLGTLPDFAVRYEYNLNGQISKLIYPGNKILEYFYNANGWLTKLRTWTGHEINYQYGRDGKPEKIFYPNGVVTTFLYNALRMPVTFGTIRSATGTSPAMTICAYNFTYDDFKNVTIERFVEQYTYANLTSKAGLTTYTHNSANNRLLTSNSPEFGLENFTHDANGRLISKGAHTYGWSVLDQLDNYTNASTGFTANILNDALGQVAAINKNGSLRWFVWSGGNPIMEADASGNPLNYYIYGLGMNAKIKADGTINFYHHDLRGSTIAMTDASGNVSHRYGYGSDGFGEVTDIYEPAGDAQFFRYNGQFGVFHLAEGWGANIKKGQLLSMRARWMDTHTGRFISEDPIWHSNLYPYGDNNPITKVDANGKFAVYVHYASTFIAAMAAGYSLSDADEIAHYASTEADHPSEAILKANQAIAFSVFAGIGGYIGGEDGMIVGGMLGVAVASRIERREGIDYSALQNSQSATSPEMNTLHCMRADGENLTREQAVNRALAGLTNSTNNKVLGNNSHTIQDCTAHNGMSSAEHVSFTKHPISATIAIFKDTFPSAFKFFKATYDTYIYLKSNK
jgi:RHS repeat-associated protein